MSAERMIDETFAPISTAPRDGRLIFVGHEDVGILLMRFDPKRTNEFFAPGQVGMWLAYDGTSTWIDDPDIGPSHWKPFQCDGSVLN